MDDLQHKFIIVHPEYEALKIEIDQLREEVSVLVMEHDYLQYQECTQIEMQYLLSIGAIEIRIYETECLVLRLKRKMELIQQRKNRQEHIELSRIDEMLEIEFAEYQAQIALQLGKLTTALDRSKWITLSEAETLELKQIYRSVVKELHPDLHPELPEERLRLFHLAGEAYGRGDLHGLRAIHAIVNNPLASDAGPKSFGALKTEKERLNETIDHLRRSIARIKTTYPYTMKLVVQSPELTERRKSELNLKQESLNERYSAYQQRIDELLR